MFSALRIACISTILVTIVISSSSFAEQLRYHKTSEAGVSYELIIESEAPEVMQPLPVTINISKPNGTPVTGAHINCSLTMPAMAMPNNKPPIKESKQPGQYNGIFLLTMGGLWHVELSSTHITGEQEIVVIPIPGLISQGDGDTIDSKLEDLFHEGKRQANGTGN